MHEQYNELCIIGGNNSNPETEDNSNNGLISKIWGPGLWIGLHSITFGYPVKPTEEQQKNYKQYFILQGDVLPCKYCRESYKQITSSGKTKITDEVFKNRETITRWLYDVHEAVNKKLGVNYNITYEDVVKKYEAFRAKCKKGPEIKGCVMPLDSKSQCYKFAYYKTHHIIPLNIAEKFLKYAKQKGLTKEDLSFYYIYKNNEKLRQRNADINCEEWFKRNKEADKILIKMQTEGTMSIDENGLPTKEELQLIMLLTSNLSNKKLEKIIAKLPKTTGKVYRLKKAN